MQFQIRWLMVAVAVLAVLLSLPSPVILLSLVLVLALALSVLVLLPAAIAPRGHRVEVAYWAMALHPLILLAWLGIWRSLLDPRQLRPIDGGWYLGLTLEIPYFLAWLSFYYLWVFLAVGGIVGTSWLSERIIARPLLVLLAVLTVTRIVLACDPFRMSDWFWD